MYRKVGSNRNYDLFSFSFLNGKDTTSNSSGKPVRIYNTIRLTTEKPVIDGNLNDECWKTGDWAGDFTQWIPDYVVINLGTNDFSEPPIPSKEDFISKYFELLNRVRFYYLNALIFCISGPTQSEPFFTYMNEIFTKIFSIICHPIICISRMPKRK